MHALSSAAYVQYVKQYVVQTATLVASRGLRVLQSKNDGREF